MENIELIIKEAKESKENSSRDRILLEYSPFVLSEVAKVATSRHISKNDYEYSVGLSALNEALDKYDFDKGTFMNYAAIVIRSRVLDYIKGEKKHGDYLPLQGDEVLNVEDKSYSHSELKDEVLRLREVLSEFKIDIEDIVDDSPKHEITKLEISNLGKMLAADEKVLKFIYEKKRLPIVEIVNKYKVSKKVLNYHKKFIIFVVVIFAEGLTDVASYIR